MRDPVVLGTIGDSTPLEYDGGYVFQYEDGSVQIEYAEGPEEDHPFFCYGRKSYNMPYRDAPYRLYVVNVEEDVKRDLSWLNKKDWAQIACRGNGEDSKTEGERLAYLLSPSATPMERAMLYWDVALQHGWENLCDPLHLTGEELVTRWNGVKGHSFESTGWGDETAELRLWEDQCEILLELFGLLGRITVATNDPEELLQELIRFLDKNYGMLSRTEAELRDKIKEACFPKQWENDE